jgi:dihydroorotate dehydrogenase electron transfer subunit
MPVTTRNSPLIRREELAGAYRVLTFKHADVATHAYPGQFVMIKAGRSAEPPLRRPFSILSVDRNAGTFSLFVKVIGPGTRALDGLALGEGAQCLGPLGRPFPAPQERRETLLIAGGYGVAPFLLLLQQMADPAPRLRVFYGGRTLEDLPLRDRFPEGAAVVLATEDGSLGHRGRVTEPLERHLDSSPSIPALYACGPEPMLRAVARIGEERCLETHVSLDPWMGCGFGTCLACVVRVQRPGEGEPHYRRACTEGPVFDASEIVWPDEAESLASRASAQTAT